MKKKKGGRGKAKKKKGQVEEIRGVTGKWRLQSYSLLLFKMNPLSQGTTTPSSNKINCIHCSTICPNNNHHRMCDPSQIEHMIHLCVSHAKTYLQHCTLQYNRNVMNSHQICSKYKTDL